MLYCPLNPIVLPPKDFHYQSMLSFVIDIDPVPCTCTCYVQGVIVS